LTGSGVETIAHLRENGRIVITFCAFDGPPKILRLYGRGEVLEPSHPDFAALRPRFPVLPGVRSIIRVRLTRIADSCGYGVPRYAYEAERAALKEWGAPDTEALVFESVLPEDRESAMATAVASDAFIKWAKQDPETGESPVENGMSNLVWYDDTE